MSQIKPMKSGERASGIWDLFRQEGFDWVSDSFLKMTEAGFTLVAVSKNPPPKPPKYYYDIPLEIRAA
jgi:hypothetical protein